MPTAANSPAPLSVNVASNFVAMAVRILTGFVVAPLLIQGLGTARYGAWTLLAQVLSYFSLFDFGIRGAVGYWIVYYAAAGDEDKVREVVPTAFWLLAPVSGLLALVGLGFAQLAPRILDVNDIPPPEIVTALSILSVVIAMALPAGCLDAVLTSRQRFDLANGVEIAYLLASSTALLTVVLTGGGLIGASLAQAGAYSLRWMLLYYLAGRVSPEFSLSPSRFSRTQVSQLYRLGGRKVVMDVSQLLISRTDLIVAGIFLDLPAVALFSVGRQIADQIASANGAVARVFTPRMTSLYSAGKSAELMAAYLSCSNLTACLSLTALVGVLLFAKPFLTLWVGSEFVSGTLMMRSDVVASVLVLAALPAMLFAGLRQTVFASGEWSLLMWLSLCEALGNLVLSLALVKPLGLLGIAIGTLVPAVVTTGILLPWLSSRRDGISIGRWWREAISRPLVAIIGAGLVVLGVQSQWPISTWFELILEGVGLVALCGLAIWFWALSPANRMQAEARLRLSGGRG